MHGDATSNVRLRVKPGSGHRQVLPPGAGQTGQVSGDANVLDSPGPGIPYLHVISRPQLRINELIERYRAIRDVRPGKTGSVTELLKIALDLWYQGHSEVLCEQLANKILAGNVIARGGAHRCGLPSRENRS
jgi:hypothetical protein